MTFLDLHVEGGPKFDQVRIAGGPMELGLDPFSIKMDRQAVIEAEIHEASLLAFLRLQAPPQVGDISVRIADELIRISGSIRVIVELKASADCKLRVEDEKVIWVDLESADALGGAGRSMIENQIAKINPVFDASKLPVDVRIQSVVAQNGKIVISASAQPKAG